MLKLLPQMFKVSISQNKELIQLEKTYYLRRSTNASAPRFSGPRHLGAVSVTAQPAAPNPAAGGGSRVGPLKTAVPPSPTALSRDSGREVRLRLKPQRSSGRTYFNMLLKLSDVRLYVSGGRVFRVVCYAIC